MNLYESIINGNTSNTYINKAAKFHMDVKKLSFYQFGAFESTFLPSLILSKQFIPLRQVNQYFQDLENNQNKRNNNILVYKYLYMVINGKKLKESDILEMEKNAPLLNPLDSVHSKIVGLVVKASYFLSKNDLEKAYENFRYAIELSHFHDYRLFEVRLLKILEANLRKFGENTKANECHILAKNIVGKSGFNFDLL
jgi:hypothetical protein